MFIYVERLDSIYEFVKMKNNIIIVRNEHHRFRLTFKRHIDNIRTMGGIEVLD